MNISQNVAGRKVKCRVKIAQKLGLKGYRAESETIVAYVKDGSGKLLESLRRFCKMKNVDAKLAQREYDDSTGAHHNRAITFSGHKNSIIQVSRHPAIVTFHAAIHVSIPNGMSQQCPFSPLPDCELRARRNRHSENVKTAEKLFPNPGRTDDTITDRMTKRNASLKLAIEIAKFLPEWNKLRVNSENLSDSQWKVFNKMNETIRKFQES